MNNCSSLLCSIAPANPSKAIAHPDLQLGGILVNQKRISTTQLEVALAAQSQQNVKLGKLLVTQGLISEEDLEQTLREQYWCRKGYWVI